MIHVVDPSLAGGQGGSPDLGEERLLREVAFPDFADLPWGRTIL
jgi:hypothetical protein